MDFSFLTPKFLATFIHLFGVALGLGGAFTSDAMFFSSIKDKVIINTELRFLKLGSIMVWTGLSLIILSGLALLYLDFDRLINSGKFLAKMNIVMIITLNGLIFHFTHIKWIQTIQGKNLTKLSSYPKRKPALLIAGTISVVSWIAALTLGTITDLTWSYFTIMTLYTLTLFIATTTSLSLKKHLL